MFDLSITKAANSPKSWARKAVDSHKFRWVQLNDRNKLIQKFIQINSRFLISIRAKFLSSWLFFVSSEKPQGGRGPLSTANDSFYIPIF